VAGQRNTAEEPHPAADAEVRRGLDHAAGVRGFFPQGSEDQELGQALAARLQEPAQPRRQGESDLDPP
jgi:hypothetical protein